MENLPPSILEVLRHRGYDTPERIAHFLRPPLDSRALSFPDMDKAVGRLRQAIRQEAPIVLYADRDVDGLSGLAVLARTLRTLGAIVHWGSPLEGRGLERPVLESLVKTGASVLILVDCGTAERAELEHLAGQGVDVIVADHHRMLPERPPAFAWIHPEAAAGTSSNGRKPFGENGSALSARPGDVLTMPCGSVMAFRLAEGILRSFIGSEDPERLNYFLFDHLDLVALGILADRVPLVGENRALVWHGLRRLALTRKEGLASLLRFFRIKGEAVSVRQATWQIIPLLNAAGRLREPHWASDLLITEDPWRARECIDSLLGLNHARRQAQSASVDHFEKTVLEQCVPTSDPVLVATARDLEPSVTGLAAQSLVQKYGRPAFLFVEQGEDLVGSGRGTSEVDLFHWIERHRDLLVKFGGHQGAVGLTVRKSDFPALREGLMASALEEQPTQTGKLHGPEAEVPFEEANTAWWESLQRLEPFGEGFEMPVFALQGVEEVVPRSKRSRHKMMLRGGAHAWPAEAPGASWKARSVVLATPQATPKEEFPFQWILHDR